MLFKNPYNPNLMDLNGFTDVLKLVGGALDTGAGDTASGMPAMPTNTNTNTNQNTVATNISVSPQISPVFQQQFQPSNSPLSAGTSMSAPTTFPSAGASPLGFPTSAAPMPLPSNIAPSGLSAPIDWNKYIMYGAIAVGGLLLYKMFSNRGGSIASRRRRVRRARPIRAKAK